jgi:hypothetical protein
LLKVIKVLAAVIVVTPDIKVSVGHGSPWLAKGKYHHAMMQSSKSRLSGDN